ncbi:MAG: thioredoxin family protein [Luteimonas sp.]
MPETQTAPGDFFATFPMRAVASSTLDDVLAVDGLLRILFLWGHDCPNCDIAKAQMRQSPAAFRWPDVEWLHDNVYEDRAMATRFGLHGIPTFMVFRGATKLGRISPWPGSEQFIRAIERVRAR